MTDLCAIIVLCSSPKGDAALHPDFLFFHTSPCSLLSFIGGWMDDNKEDSKGRSRVPGPAAHIGVGCGSWEGLTGISS